MKSPDDAEPVAARGDMALQGRTFLLGDVLSAAAAVGAGGFAGCSRKPSRAGGGRSSGGCRKRHMSATGASPVGVPAAIGDHECSTGEPTGLQTLIGGLGVPGRGIRSAASARSTTTCSGPSGLWNMSSSQSSNFWEIRILPQVAFHVREQVEGVRRPDRQHARHPARQHRPAAELRWRVPTWKQLSPDDGTYAALCSFGWTTYKAGNPRRSTHHGEHRAEVLPDGLSPATGPLHPGNR